MKYAKFAVAAIGAAATSIITTFGGDTKVGQVATIILAIVTALAVYAVPNQTETEAQK